MFKRKFFSGSRFLTVTGLAMLLLLTTVGALYAHGPLLETSLSGDAEVPGPGDPDGSGSARISAKKSNEYLCFKLQVSDIDTVTAAHIHAGAADESGPVAINLDVAANGLSACIPADKVTMKDIFAHPENYYVNIHNAEYPAGALRGQLGMDEE